VAGAVRSGQHTVERAGSTPCCLQDRVSARQWEPKPCCLAQQAPFHARGRMATPSHHQRVGGGLRPVTTLWGMTGRGFPPPGESKQRGMAATGPISVAVDLSLGNSVGAIESVAVETPRKRDKTCGWACFGPPIPLGSAQIRSLWERPVAFGRPDQG